MPRHTDLNRILAILAAFFGLLTVSCVGTVLYQVTQSARALGRTMELASAAMAGDLTNAKRLLAEGANPNYEDCWTSLDAAVQNDNLPMVRLLLDHGANVRHACLSMEPVLLLAQSDAVFNCLLDRGADVNARSLYEGHETVLMQAVRNANADRVRRLLAHGANPYLKNESGETVFDVVPRTGIYSKQDQAKIVTLLHNSAGRSQSQ